jgi:hypothetical protein
VRPDPTALSDDTLPQFRVIANLTALPEDGVLYDRPRSNVAAGADHGAAPNAGPGGNHYVLAEKTWPLERHIFTELNACPLHDRVGR